MESAHRAELCVRYEVGPDEADPPEDPASFEASAGGAFLVAWLETDGGDSQPVAMGGVKRLGEDAGRRRGELKRMFVVEEARGRGIARELLERLEDEARALGYDELWLESGTPQFEALALYESAGYELVANYGRYKDHPSVRCYAKSL
jgi:GNAT superfamily N-acetyltransferase